MQVLGKITASGVRRYDSNSGPTITHSITYKLLWPSERLTAPAKCIHVVCQEGGNDQTRHIIRSVQMKDFLGV